MPLIDDLKEFFQGEISDDPTTLDAFSKDASIFVLRPQLVLAPQDTDDIKKLIKYINTHRDQNLSITPRSAGTCMSGGAIGENLVLDMLKHFNTVQSVKEKSAVTQPGVYYRDFEKQTLAKNLLLPCYTSSRELNTMGGMVGNNSAGEKTLTYGQTERWVKKLKVVLSDGEEHEFRPLDKTELKQKLEEKGFEGDLYRAINQLIEENQELIKNAEPQTSKNATGYYLWKVTHDDMFDLTKLIIGSQGTLGVVTEIEFALVPPKPHTAMLEIELENLNDLDRVVNEVLAFNPESFECFDDQTLRFATRYMADVVKDFKKTNKFVGMLKLIPEYLEHLTNHFPAMVLIAEFTAEDDKSPMEQVLKTQEALKKFNLHTHAVQSADEEKYWILRRDSFNILRHHSGDNLRTCPFIDDIIVNPKDLPQFLPRLQATLKPYSDRITYTIAGHIGNANFHIIPLMNMADPKIRALVPEISEKVFSLVFEFKGSMSAEHNDGLARGMYLPQMYGEDVFQLFRQVKLTFDPYNIFNPHKKTDATMEFSSKHIGSNTGIVVQDYQPAKPPTTK